MACCFTSEGPRFVHVNGGRRDIVARKFHITVNEFVHQSNTPSHTRTHPRIIKCILPRAQTPLCLLSIRCTISYTHTHTHTHLFSTTVIQYQYNIDNIDTWELYHTGIYLQYHVCRASITSSAFWEMQSVMNLFFFGWFAAGTVLGLSRWCSVL